MSFREHEKINRLRRKYVIVTTQAGKGGMKLSVLSTFVLSVISSSLVYGQAGTADSWIFDLRAAGREHIALEHVGKFIYGGGFFEVASSGENLQRFNLATEAWEPVPNYGTNNTVAVRALHYSESEGLLYAGGNGRFGAANGNTAVFNLTTETWSTLRDDSLTGEETGTQAGGFIRDIIIFEGQPVIAGSLLGTTITNGNNIRRYDRNAGRWLSLGDGLSSDTTIGDEEILGAPGTIWDLEILPDGRLYAAGGFTRNGAGTRQIPSLAVLENGSWQAVAGGVDGVIRKMLVTEDGVYVVGNFSSVGSGATQVAARDIALLQNDGLWNSLGSENFMPVSGANENGIFDICQTDDGTIYFVGVFEVESGGTTLKRVASWDGTRFGEVGGGVGRTTSQIAQSCVAIGQNLFVGGNYTIQGRTGNVSFARWNADQDFSDYVTGSNDPRNLFQWVPEITEVNGDQISIRIPGGTRIGDRYQLQFSPNLETEFTNVGFSEPGTFDSERDFPTVTNNSGRGFYRVQFVD